MREESAVCRFKDHGETKYEEKKKREREKVGVVKIDGKSVKRSTKRLITWMRTRRRDCDSTSCRGVESEISLENSHALHSLGNLEMNRIVRFSNEQS